MSAPMNVLAVLDAAIDDCVWLRKNSIKTMSLEPDTIAEARDAVAALIAERDALREALSEAEWRLSCIGTPRDAQGRYHKDGEWTFGDALPNSADAREVASAFALIRAALTTGESA